MWRKANEFLEISQVYFRAGRKELTELINRLSSSLLEEVVPTMKRVQRSGFGPWWLEKKLFSMKPTRRLAQLGPILVPIVCSSCH